MRYSGQQNHDCQQTPERQRVEHQKLKQVHRNRLTAAIRVRLLQLLVLFNFVLRGIAAGHHGPDQVVPVRSVSIPHTASVHRGRRGHAELCRHALRRQPQVAPETDVRYAALWNRAQRRHLEPVGHVVRADAEPGRVRRRVGVELGRSHFSPGAVKHVSHVDDVIGFLLVHAFECDVDEVDGFGAEARAVVYGGGGCHGRLVLVGGEPEERVGPFRILDLHS